MNFPHSIICIAILGCSPNAPGYNGVSEELPTGSSAINAAGLVASYDMESTTPAGGLRDFGPNALHGTIRSTAPVDGPFGMALRFDSVGYRIQLPDAKAFELPGPVTIAAWVRVNTLDQHQHIFACDDSWALWVTPANYFRLGDTRGSGFDSREGSIKSGEWQSVVAVLSGTQGDVMSDETVQMYVDGESVLGTHGEAWNSAELYPTDACYLGFESHQGNVAHQTLPFHGDIDDIMVFSRAWSAEEAMIHAGR
jgi:hypothetical protein